MRALRATSSGEREYRLSSRETAKEPGAGLCSKAISPAMPINTAVETAACKGEEETEAQAAASAPMEQPTPVTRDIMACPFSVEITWRPSVE